MSTTAEEEAEIETLLAGVASSIMPAMPGDAAAADAQRQQQKQQQHAETPKEATDRLVLDAACGGASAWDARTASLEVDYVEQRGNGTWAASVSVVLSLVQFVDEALTTKHMHDETGSGHVEGMPTESAAVETAERLAISSALRRLAKRFALSFSNEMLAAISRQAFGHANSAGQAHLLPPPGKRKRPR